MRKCDYSLLFLDIVMDKQTGLEFASELRRAGSRVNIVFITSSAEYALEAYEVAVWHKEGHSLMLKAGGVVELNGTRLDINMDGAVNINSASLKHNGKNVGDDHTHGGVLPGTADTLGPN